jgi:hypothetical protein
MKESRSPTQGADLHPNRIGARSSHANIPFTLCKVDQAWGKFTTVSDDLDSIKAQLARHTKGAGPPGAARDPHRGRPRPCRNPSAVPMMDDWGWWQQDGRAHYNPNCIPVRIE